MNDIIISVIVPVYNAEVTLQKCVESVLNQSIHNIELILINDGSKDKSLEICQRFAEKDERILIVNNSNHGVSYSRNIGLNMASGDYILFLDSDDWFAENAFTKMESVLKKEEPDILFTGFNKEYKVKSQYVTVCNSQTAYYMEEKKEFNPYNTRILGTVWGKAYKKQFIGSTRFSEDLKLCEDAEFNYRLLKEAKKMIYCNFSSYHYVYNAASTIRKYNSEQIKQYELALKRICIDTRNCTAEIEHSYNVFVCNVYTVIVMNSIFSSSNNMKMKEKIRILENILSQKIFINSIRNVDLTQLSKQQSELIKLSRRKRYLSIWILSILNNVRGKLLYR